MKIDFIASLPDSGPWFAPKKDGSGVVRFELAASEFTKVIHLSQFMDCFTKGGAAFKVTIERCK